MYNRLKLNFTISSLEDRTSFVNNYLKENAEIFDIKPLNEKELETIANYILWGKNKDGKNVAQLKEIQLETRNKTWDKKEEESLDALVESPNFRESMIKNYSAQTRIQKETFSRPKARKEAPPYILEKLEFLWKEIDKLDLLINYYDLAHEKRKKPPRESLLNIFTEKEQNALRDSASDLSQFSYLKKRHLLVELRREQFTLRDSYRSQIMRTTAEAYAPPTSFFFDSEIPVLPLGLNNKKPIDMKIFPPKGIPEPANFSEEDLRLVSKRLWTNPTSSSFCFDFRQLEHVYQVFQIYETLVDDSLTSEVESTLTLFLETLYFYINFAHLTPLQMDILRAKIAKQKNQDIAIFINRKYKKTYNANYISTIFRQKIIAAINSAAALHYEIIQNLFFPENFKKCRGCGRTLLLTSDNFVRKAKSKDGFVSSCKECEKKSRQEKK